MSGYIIGEAALGKRVRIHTTTGGCYHKHTGVVTRILNGAMTPLDTIPAGAANRDSHWYQVKFDTPADNGGKLVEEEIFLREELKFI